MKKNLLALLLALSMTLALAACGGSAEAPEAETDTPVTEDVAPTPEGDDVVTELPEVDPDANTPAAPEENPEMEPSMPTVNPEPAPEVENTPEVKPEPKPEENTPSQPPVEEAPSAPAGSVDLDEFYYALYDQLYPLDADGFSTGPFVNDITLAPEMVDAFYPGLSAINPKQLHIFIPAMTGVPYELVLVEVGSSNDVDTVKAILQTRIDTESTNPVNYPPVQEAWKSNSQIVSNGNFILMACCSDHDTYVSAFNGLF